jgi:putative addiction module killer protein
METLENLPIYEPIIVKLDKVERGNLGDARGVGGGVSELEIDVDGGYRVYFGQIGKNGEIVVLLNGGTKSSQAADIAIAKRYWKDFCRDPED